MQPHAEIPHELLPVTRRHSDDLHLTAMRVHEVALQAWCYRHFYVAEGYPVPVVFAWPMDAFGEFNKLWQSQNSNPFAYLLNLKDSEGRPARFR